MGRTFAPTLFAVALVVTAMAVMAANWLLVAVIVCALLAGARMAHSLRVRRHRNLR